MGPVSLQIPGCISPVVHRGMSSGRGVAEARRFSAFLRVYQRLIMLGMSDIAVAV